MFGKRYLRSKDSVTAAVGAASVELLLPMLPGKGYVFVSNIACWIKQGPTTTVTATAGSGSSLIPAGVMVDIHGSNGNAIALIQDAAGGKASLTPMDEI